MLSAWRINSLSSPCLIVKSNPFARRGTFKEEPKGQYIPDEEFWDIHKFLPEYLKPVIVTAYYTGMRRGEILELEWNRVDIMGGVIDLTPEDTKTEEPRHIFFNSIPELKNALINASKNRSVDQNLVFTKFDGSPVPKFYIQRLLKKACKNDAIFQ